MSDDTTEGDDTPACSRCGRPAPYRVGVGERVKPVCERHLHERHSEVLLERHPTAKLVNWLERYDDLWVPPGRLLSAILSPVFGLTDRLYNLVSGAATLAYKFLWMQLETLRADTDAVDRARQRLVDAFLDRRPLPHFADQARDLLADRHPRATLPEAIPRYRLDARPPR